MKIVTWNCNGALRKKFEFISTYKADIYIIQECESPEMSKHEEYKSWSANSIWIGDNKNKGLGIFSSNDEIKLDRLEWSNKFRNHPVKYFLPCIINDDFKILGVWNHRNNSPTFGYIGQFWKYMEINKSKFDKIIIAGDFNSNSIWDRWDRWWNHSDVIKNLSEINIESFYHKYFREEQGAEKLSTFFHYRNKEKAYHIDYIFGSKIFHEKLKRMEIGDIDEWLKISDHVPVLSEFEY